MELADALLGTSGAFREIEIKTLGNTRDSRQRCVLPRPEYLGGGWRKILIGGEPFEKCEDSDIRNTFDLFFKSKDLEEMAIPYISWVRSACFYIGSG